MSPRTLGALGAIVALVATTYVTSAGQTRGVTPRTGGGVGAGGAAGAGPKVELPTGGTGTIRLTPDGIPPGPPTGPAGGSSGSSTSTYRGADPNALIWNGCPPSCPDLTSYPDDPIARAVRNTAGIYTLDTARDALTVVTPINQRRAMAVLKILAADMLIVLKPAQVAVQRQAVIEHARHEIQAMVLRAVAQSVREMKAQIAALTPYRWNPFGSKAREEMARISTEVDIQRERAEAAITSGQNTRTLHSGNRESAVHVVAGDAMKQLQHIDATKLWKNQ